MLKVKKKEKKLSIKNKKVKRKKKCRDAVVEDDLFMKKPELIDLIIPDCIHEKRDQVVLGEKRYSRVFVLATYPSKTFIGWLDKIFEELRRYKYKHQYRNSSR